MTAPRYHIDEAGLRHLVETFYARVRADEVLGPVFNDAVDDWPHHFTALTAFWSSVMLGSGRYKGQPVPAHRQHIGRIDEAMFDRWLGLWAATTSELMPPDEALALQDKAARIAESLKLALFFRIDRPQQPKEAKTMPGPQTPPPYKTTPVFDQDTLPQALRREHRTKEGTWGLLRVLEGRVTLTFTDPPRDVDVTPGHPAQIPPQETHFVTPHGPVTLQVEFHLAPPLPSS